MDRSKLLNVVGELGEMAAYEAVQTDHDKKVRLLDEYYRRAMETKMASPDEIEALIWEMLERPDPRYPRRGSARNSCPATVQLAEDNDGVEKMARRVRDLMINDIKHGIGGTDAIHTALAVMEEYCATVLYRYDDDSRMPNGNRIVVPGSDIVIP